MRINTIFPYVALVSVVALFALGLSASIINAQLGEIAGPLNYTIGLGGTSTLNMTIFNSGTAPLPFKVIPPLFRTAIANTTKPIVSIAPLSGVLAPSQSQKIAVTITIPTQNNKPGYAWSGIMQVLETPNSTQQGVAIIEGGVAKGVNVTAAQPVFNPLEVVIPAVIIIIIAAIAVLWKKGVIKVGAGVKKKAAAPSKKSATKAKRTTKKAKAGTRKRTTTKRKASRKSRSSSSSRARARRRRR